MAEFVMKDMVKKAGLEDAFYIESAAISAEELGNPVYPPARQLMERHGLHCTGKVARQMKKRDYDAFDLLIGMDGSNLRGMHCICGGDVSEKMHLLLDYTDHPRDVADPWYTRDFEATWQDVQEGCAGLLKHLCGTVDNSSL